MKTTQDKLSEMMKTKWSTLANDLVMGAKKTHEEAEHALEDLKDASAILSSEIAEHLSPQEVLFLLLGTFLSSLS